MSESAKMIRHKIRQVYGEIRVDRKDDRVVILLGRYDICNDQWNDEGVIDLSDKEALDLKNKLEMTLSRIWGQ